MSDRPNSRSRGYTWRWEKARKRFLAEHPLCAMCMAKGRVTAATVVHHNPPHQGDMDRFWDRSTWEPLCATHHNSDAQAIEKGGKPRRETGADGWPI